MKKRHLPTDPVIDYGSRGAAYRSRPSSIRETIQAGVTYRAYSDAHLIDRMHQRAQLSDLQYEAAQRVIELHNAAGFEPNTTSGYVPPGWNKGHDDDEQEAAAITRFRFLLGSRSAAAAGILHGMCLEQHPGTGRLATLRASLDDLVKQWGLA